MEHLKLKIAISGILMFFGAFVAFTKQTKVPVDSLPQYIPPSQQRNGDAKKGYEYLTTGDFIKSGIPYSYYKYFNIPKPSNYLGRTGKNGLVAHGFNVVKSDNGTEVVVPTCLQCHSQEFEGKLYVGMGNTFQDFSNISAANNPITDAGANLMKFITPKQYQAAAALFNSFDAILPKMETEVRGVNAADRLAMLLVAHRDPKTLVWQNKPLLKIPQEVVPTDVPAWWLLKKKNAMFYNGFGRGDFGKFLMLSNILTVKDSSEAREVDSHFGDVLAYLKSIEPPKYPKGIDSSLALHGKTVFNETCSRCHGTYGKDGSYPNLLIPASIIKTDSLLYKSNQQNKEFIDWFNNSWFATGDHPAKLVPYDGYIAPPLDGIWATAPYLHNGSVPNLETLLNSKERPTYWKRSFSNPKYDYEKIGWVYTTPTKAKRRKTYNTKLIGYGNSGHYFGDRLSNVERKAVIEYLKTL